MRKNESMDDYVKKEEVLQALRVIRGMITSVSDKYSGEEAKIFLKGELFGVDQCTNFFTNLWKYKNPKQ